MSYAAALAQHYREVRTRLRAPEFPVPTPGYSRALVLSEQHLRIELIDEMETRERYRLPAPSASLPSEGAVPAIADIVPSQLGCEPHLIRTLPDDAERIATRRAIAAYFAAIRAHPSAKRMKLVKRVVAAAFKIDVAALESRARTVGIVRIRQIAMWIAREFTSLSLGKIGYALGGRDHATVIHGARKVAPLTRSVFTEMYDGATCQIDASRAVCVDG
jgi:DnaA-like protein